MREKRFRCRHHHRSSEVGVVQNSPLMRRKPLSGHKRRAMGERQDRRRQFKEGGGEIPTYIDLMSCDLAIDSSRKSLCDPGGGKICPNDRPLGIGSKLPTEGSFKKSVYFTRFRVRCRKHSASSSSLINRKEKRKME